MLADGTAVRIACLLDLHLHCVSVEDEALIHLSSLPFARELRLPSHTWTKLQAEEMAHALGHTAERLRRDTCRHRARLRTQTERLPIPAREAPVTLIEEVAPRLASEHRVPMLVG